MSTATAATTRKRMYIDGKWCDADSGRALGVINPATEEVLMEIAYGGRAETRRALEAAHKAMPAWMKLTAWDRAKVLKKTAELMRERCDAIARTLTLEQGKPLPEDVLFVQIRSFPDDALAEPASKGWFFQAYAPLNGLLSVRTTAQLVRDREELEMFAERWRKSPEAGRKYARIHFAGFEFLGKNPPLSWSMNPRQKAEIGDQWKDPKISGGTDMQEVRCLFQPTSGCNALPDKGPW